MSYYTSTSIISYNSFSKIMISFLLIAFAQCIYLFNKTAQFLLNYIITSNDVIQSKAIYSFRFLRFSTTPIPINSQLRMTFGNPYIGKIISNPQCSSVTFNTTVLACTFIGNTMIMNNLFSNSQSLTSSNFIVSVSNITNPSPATNYIPIQEIKIIAPDSTVVEQQSTSLSLTIKPAQATCISQILNGYTYLRGQLSINYLSKFANLANGYNLSISIPKYYQNDQTQTDINPTFSIPVTFVPLSDRNSYIINYLTNFTITLLMPPSTKPQNNFIYIYSLNQLGNYDQCSISINNISPNTFSLLNISSQAVQTTSSLYFHLQLSTPLFQRDILIINFDSSFSLASVRNTIDISSFGTKTITIINNNIEISAISSQSIIDAVIKFSLIGVGMPFTAKSVFINVSLITNDYYGKIIQQYLYTPVFGNLATGVACLNQEIGISTTCIFSLNTTSSINSKGYIDIVLPNQFQISAGSQQCQITAVGLNSLTTCLFIAVNNTIQVGSLTSSSLNIPPISISINIAIDMPRVIKLYTIGIYTNAFGSKVDFGTTSMSTLSRQLKSTEFHVKSSSLTTLSVTTYNLIFSLPFNTGYTYTCSVYLPFRTQTGLSVDILGGSSLSFFNNSLLIFNALGLLNNETITINNLLTHVSLEPINIQLNITFSNILYFKGSFILTMQQIKTFSYITSTQNNQIVYQNDILTLTLSQLSIGDKIVLRSSYSHFYAASQSNCSSSVVTCGLSNIITILSINNELNSLTKFQLNMINLAYIGQSTVNITLYDNSQTYAKLSSLIIVRTLFPNSITIQGQQSNPNLNQPSNYAFNLSLKTPNPSHLQIVFSSDLVILSSQCILGCGTFTILSSGYITPVTSSRILLQFRIQNPTSFQNSKIIFKTFNSNGEIDYGQYLPTTRCVLPCRTCLASNISLCQSCYSWQTLSALLNQTCITSCTNGYFLTNFTLGFKCQICDSKCSICFGTSKNCSSCKNNNYYYNNQCHTNCPQYTYPSSSNFICIQCDQNCSVCNFAGCTQCMLTHFLLSNQCYSSCPIGYYNIIGNRNCLSCPSTCVGCSLGLCTSCNSSLYLYKGICYQTCPNGSYQNINICSQCNKSCSTCVSSQTCTSCINTFYLFNSICLSQCPNIYYANATGNICLRCIQPCLNCNFNGCLTCIALFYHQINICTLSCQYPYYSNNVSMTCQTCQLPCETCQGWSNSCKSCIARYSLHNSNCYLNCPSSYYSSNFLCLNCPTDCLTCTLYNSQPICSSCRNNQYIYSTSCVNQCPLNTSSVGIYCASTDCSNLANCLSCSGFRCIQCTSVYKLDNNFQCSQFVSSSQVLTAFSKIPIPFPFLIAIIMIIIISFFLKHNFDKMFSPFFIYSLSGVFQFFSIILWTLLTITWNLGNINSLPILSIVYVPFLIIVLYVIINIVQFIVWKNRIASDKIYHQWQLQDNKCPSLSLAIISLFLSFRLDIIKFSRVANSYKLSARLSSQTIFHPYSIIAFISIFIISIFSIITSIYISYLQTELNYLFFTCFQISIIAIIMTILSIVMLCVPKKMVIQNKQDYQIGYDNFQLQGKSIQQLINRLDVYQEHQQNVKYIQTGNAIFQKNRFQASERSSQDHTLVQNQLKIAQQTDQFQLQVQSGDQNVLKINTKRKPSANEDIFGCSVQQNDDHILIDQIQRHKQQGINLSKQYIPLQHLERQIQKVYARNEGLIIKQNIPVVDEQPSYQQSHQSFQQYTLQYKQNNWMIKQNKHQVELTAEIQQEQQYQIQKLKEEQMKRRKQYEMAKALKRIKKENNKFKKKQQQLAINDKIRKQEIKKHEQQLARIRLQKNISQIKRLDELNQKLRDLQQYQIGLYRKQHQLLDQQDHLLQLQEELQRENRERALMGIQDKLSQYAKVFYEMKVRSDKLKNQFRKKCKKKIIKTIQQQQFKQQKPKKLIYSNDDYRNLMNQISPKKIKVNPSPLPSQYQKSHVYIQQNEEILSQSSKQSSQQSQRQIDYIYQQDYFKDITQQFPDPNPPTNLKIREKIKQIQSFNNKPVKVQNVQIGQTQKIKEYINNLNKIDKKKKEIPKLQQERGFPINFQNHQSDFIQEKDDNQITLKQQNKLYFDENKHLKNGAYSLKMQPQMEYSEETIEQPQYIDPYLSNTLSNNQIQGVQPVLSYQAKTQSNEQKQQYNNQIIIYDDEQTVSNQNQQIQIEYSSRQINSHSSEGTHWPIEPQMQERIRQIEKRADQYIKRPKRIDKKKEYEFQAVQNKQIAQEDEVERQLQKIQYIYEQREESFEDKSLSHNEKKKKYPIGRVNRHIIDLSPDH